MRNFIAIAAALAINLAVVIAFQHSADEAVPVPNGEVTVTELGVESVAALADASTAESQRAAL